MMNPGVSIILGSMFIALVLSGCRTYGDYGTEEATFAEIEDVNSRFADELDRAQAEQATLQRAAGQYGDLKPFNAHYDELLSRHEALVASHAALTAQLSVKTGPMGRLTSSYRDLNRALGNIVADQQMMKDLYEEFAQELAGLNPETRSSTSRYEIVPPFYERIHAELDRISISEAVDYRRE